MRRLFLSLLPTSRVGALLFLWRNRYRALDWLGFGLRTAGSMTSGKGSADARAELRLRAALARDAMTRGLAIEVRVVDGVCTLSGRVSTDVHARIQDKAAAIPGIRRVDDRLVNVSMRKRFRLRAV